MKLMYRRIYLQVWEWLRGKLLNFKVQINWYLKDTCAKIVMEKTKIKFHVIVLSNKWNIQFYISQQVKLLPEDLKKKGREGGQSS